MTARGALALGLALAAAVAVWWLGSAAIALRSASPVAPVARDLLIALLTVRALAIAVTGVEVGRSASWREASGALALVAAAGWPLVLVGQWASDVPPWPVVVAEIGLLGLAAAMAALGGAVAAVLGKMRRAPPSTGAPRGTSSTLETLPSPAAPPSLEALRPAAYAAGLLVAVALWWQRALWLAWLSA